MSYKWKFDGELNDFVCWIGLFLGYFVQRSLDYGFRW